jgi:hypothetical protein
LLAWSRMLERPMGRSSWHGCKGVPPSSFLNGGVAARCWAPYTYPSHRGQYGNVRFFGNARSVPGVGRRFFLADVREKANFVLANTSLGLFFF